MLVAGAVEQDRGKPTLSEMMMADSGAPMQLDDEEEEEEDDDGARVAFVDDEFRPKDAH